MKCLGMATNLNTFPSNEIAKGELDMAAKQILLKRQHIDYGVSIDALPIWTDLQWIKEMKMAKQQNRVLVVESGIVFDVTTFIKEVC